MNSLSEYVRNVFCLYIIISIAGNLTANEKYARYIRLFGGIMIIIAVMRPVISMFGINVTDISVDVFEDYQLSEEVYGAIMQAEAGRNQEIIDAYYASVKDKVNEYAAQWGYSAHDTSVEINLDQQSEDYGKVVLIRTQLEADENTYVTDSEAVFSGYDIVTIKNNLANFYNIPVSNIYINIYNRQDNKEGA
ncbi:MAG: stage III sporulation protein AF [Lachnospiraceae bacterium]